MSRSPWLCKWALVLAVASQWSQGCKTSSSSSELDAWTLNGSEAAAKEFIIETVVTVYPNIKKDDPALGTFAAALMDRTVAHSETTRYVLDAKAAKGKAELERYVVNEFATSTNLFEVLADGGALRYLGPADKIYLP